MALPKHIHEQIVDSKDKRLPVFLSSNGLDIAFQTKIVKVDGLEVILENLVRPEYIRKFTSGTQFTLLCKMIRLQSSHISPSGTYISFTIQDNSVIDETRQSERFMFAPEEKVYAEILNPFDQTTIIRRPVMDMSASGLSIRMNSTTKMFQAGVTLPEVRVAIDGKPYHKASANVVYGRKFLDYQGRLRVQVGLKFS